MMPASAAGAQWFCREKISRLVILLVPVITLTGLVFGRAPDSGRILSHQYSDTPPIWCWITLHREFHAAAAHCSCPGVGEFPDEYLAASSIHSRTSGVFHSRNYTSHMPRNSKLDELLTFACGSHQLGGGNQPGAGGLSQGASYH